MGKVNINPTTILLIAIAVMATGCEVLKGKHRVASDTVFVHKTDSVYVNRTDAVINDSFKWFRAILDYRNNRDTNVTNIYNTYPQGRPQILTIESGSGGSQTIIQQVDSGYKHMYDSLNAHRTEQTKSKETKVLTQWWIWAIIGVLGVLVIMLTFGRFFTITKK